MSRVGLEPTTTRLKAERSDQLSYRDVCDDVVHAGKLF